MYKSCYDKNHKMINIDLENKYANKKQKGYYDEIICSECEVASQLYDQYANLILTDSAPRSREYLSLVKTQHEKDVRGNIRTYSKWKNVDFQKLQKFLFICLLRTQLHMKKAGQLLLIDKHFDRILKLYRNSEIIDDTSYPITVVKYLNTDGLEKIIFFPFANKINGHYLIEFAGAGYLFRVFVSSHRKPEYVNTIRLNKSGSLYVLNVIIQESGTFKRSAPTLFDLASQFQDL